ncbi:MAG TPA: AAA family ATPase, partial [Fibrobacteraceae bacterium]|nr:AAA family ATPase [Fibrobacteraceae bacterium]
SRERRAVPRDRRGDSLFDGDSSGHLDLDAESRKLLEIRRIDPDALMIPWPADDWRRDLVKLLEAAFQPGEAIEFKVAETPQANRETVSTILGQSEYITKIMKSLDGSEGALIGINAVASEGAKDDSWKFRYAVVDSLRMSLSKQLAFYKALNLPCVALVNSGANTVQAWVRIEAADSTEYSERVEFLYNVLEENGFKADPSLKAASQMVRMPGVLRNGKQQYLIGLNEGARCWKDWQEWVDYCLDGNPLVELASYHKQAPSPEAFLVDGLCKTSDFFVLTAPPKAGKSLALIDLALSLCHGEPWMGQQTEETDVLFMNLDLSKATFLNRLHLVANERKIDPATPRLGLLNLRGFRMPMLDLAEFLVRRIEGARKYEEHDYRVIVIDPVLSLLHAAGSTDLGGDLTMLADIVSSRTGAAVVVALSLDELATLHINPDSSLELFPADRPGVFQFRSACKDFPPLSGRECLWKYPRFIV